MFAYCLNNPVDFSDSEGTAAVTADCTYTPFDNINSGVGAGSGATAGGLILIPGLGDLGKNVVASVSSAYRKFTRSIKETIILMPPGSYPVTHHIVPYGGYSSRDPYVRQQLARAQSIMISAGVDPEHDLFNQVVISVSYHLSLHSNDYILMVTAPIIALGNNPTKDQIYEVLFYLRIGIAANDPYAYGY